MRNLFLFIKRFYPFFLFLFLEVVCVVLISRSNALQRATIVNSANEVTGFFFSTRHEITSYFGLRKSNRTLQEENARLRRTVSNLRDNRDSVRIDTTGPDIWEFLPATVINHSSNRKMNYFTLDRGAADGLEDGMGVVDSRGLAGMLTNVSPHYSVGISMLNTKTRISVKHQRSGAIGIMRWQGFDPLEHMIEDITKTAGVRSGDTLVTSGYSTFFPKGLAVAVVTEARLPEGSNFYEISATLTNDILSLDEVYVIRHAYEEEIDSLENAAE